MDLLEELGLDYLFDHVIAHVKKCSEERLYRMYVTDMLKHIANNTAGQEQRYQVDKRYIEIAEPIKPEPEKPDKPEQTNDEVINHFKNKLSSL